MTTIAHTTMTTTGDDDHVGPWIDELLAVPVPADDLPVVVAAHSAACPRTPYAVHRLLGAGWNVTGFVCVDGRYPDGVPLTASEATFGPMLDSIVRPDDYLPPWPRWWGSLVVGLVVDPAAREQVFCEARPIPRAWFDQACPVPDLPPGVGRAFLAFGPGYQASCTRAEAAGWRTYLLAGDHLHQVVAPEAVADTLLAIAGDLAAPATDR
ncbi:MAG: hypothetical protein ACFCVK_19220 [Acidimicrobiales bacterium]